MLTRDLLAVVNLIVIRFYEAVYLCVSNNCWINNENRCFFSVQADTDVLVGIKAEITKPPDEAPNKGYLEFSVDW